MYFIILAFYDCDVLKQIASVACEFFIYWQNI